MKNTIEVIKIKLSRLISEPSGNDLFERYSHPAWTFKIPKGLTPCDYDKKEKLVEIEYESGERNWFDISVFFGKVISEANEILIINDDDSIYSSIGICKIEIFKIKRSIYWKLIFETVLPF